MVRMAGNAGEGVLSRPRDRAGCHLSMCRDKTPGQSPEYASQYAGEYAPVHGPVVRFSHPSRPIVCDGLGRQRVAC